MITKKLVTTSWCGPCFALKNRLKAASIEVDMIDGDNDLEFVKNYKVKSVPTLVVISEDGTFHHVNGSDDIIEELKKKDV